MGIVSKVRKFCALDGRTMLFFVEAFFYLGWSRILISFPFCRIAPSLGDPMEETTNERLHQDMVTLARVQGAIHVMSEHTWWESRCLVRAIAALKMLERRQIESTLYLGTARDESSKMIAHAWLRSGPFLITGSEGMERFGVVGKFAKRIRDQQK